MLLPGIGLGAKALGAAFGVANKLAVPATVLYGGYELSKIPNSIKEGILTSGPNDLDSDSRYGFKVDGPINSLALMLTGDTPETLEQTYKRRERKRLLENPVVQERISALDLDPTKIDPNLGSFLQQTKKPFQDYQDLESLKRTAKPLGVTPLSTDTVESLSKKIKDVLDADPTSAKSQLGRQLESERKVEERLLRNEAERARRYKDDLVRLQQDREDQKAKDDRNFQFQMMQLQNQNSRLDREDARADRRAQQQMYLALLQGLQNLTI